jgi:hypothetical protein
MDCPQAVGAVAGSREYDARAKSDGNLFGVKLDGAAMVTELADRVQSAGC